VSARDPVLWQWPNCPRAHEFARLGHRLPAPFDAPHALAHVGRVIPWKLLASAEIPGDPHQLTLHQRGDEFSIRADRRELMNSRRSASEEALAKLACDRLKQRPRPRILVGGLGMGYTLRAALDALPAQAEIVVAELVPAVVEWNRSLLGHLADQPLNDARVRVKVEDVARLLRAAKAGYDAILLDVDNGPDAFTRDENAWLYGASGLRTIQSALRPQGILGVWSSYRDHGFEARLARGGFQVEEIPWKARGSRGAVHTIWLGTKPQR
jgi:spermidine synthase